jgi:hypothetical protein
MAKNTLVEESEKVRNARTVQGYRVKTLQRVCGNCEFKWINASICSLGHFSVDEINGTCKEHDWR